MASHLSGVAVFVLALVHFQFAFNEAAGIRKALKGPECGQSSFKRHHGIIGGNDALPGDWPWHVGIHVDGTYYCGGSIINSMWIVTAAHCIFTNTTAKDYIVRVGDTDRSFKETYEVDHLASVLIKNEDWGFPQPDSDIALIKLTKPIIFKQGVGPVCLPPEDSDVPLTATCYLSGWGITTLGSDQRSLKLQQAEMPPLSNEECSEKTEDTDDPWLSFAKVTENMICGGINGSPLSGCRGDSGGPYVCQNRLGQWVLQGVVSWGSSVCDSSQSYSVFTRVSKFTEWINDQINDY